MTLSDKSFLVTGGAGFIGSNLVHHLVAQGAHVRVFDDFSSGLRSNLTEIIDKIDLVEADLRDFEAVLKATQGVDYVLHQGAVASVPLSISGPISTSAITATGTLHVLEASRQCAVKKVILASSASIYGDSAGDGPVSEVLPIVPGSPYAASKASSELFARSYYESYGLQSICLRYFNVYGPRQVPTSPYSGVISIFMHRLSKGEELLIHGDGLQSRDFIYIDDVVAINLAACFAADVPFGVFNVGRGQSVSLLELVSQIAGALSVEPELKFSASRPGDIKHSLSDISLAREKLHFDPQIPLETGLLETCKFFGFL